MVEVLPDMPAGTLGFRISGHLTREDYSVVLLPPIREAIARGERLRILCQIDADFDGLDPGAVWEDLRAGLELEVGHPRSWERFALVTDLHWVRRAVGLAGWLVPGEIRVFPMAELEQAIAWLAA